MDAISSLPVDPWLVVVLILLIFFLLVVPFFLNLLGGWRKPRDAVNSPMTITLHTEKTPAQLNSAARFATFKQRLFWIGTATVAWAIFHVINYDMAVSIDKVVFGMLGLLFDLFAQALASMSDILTSLS